MDSALYAVHPSFPDRFLRAQGCGSVATFRASLPAVSLATTTSESGKDGGKMNSSLLQAPQSEEGQ